MSSGYCVRRSGNAGSEQEQRPLDEFGLLLPRLEEERKVRLDRRPGLRGERPVTDRDPA